MAKKKHHKNNQGVAYVEVEKDFGMWENYMPHRAAQRPTILSTTAHSSPVRPGWWNNYLSKNYP